MNKDKRSSFRSLLELSDKIAREELGNYYIVSEGRMENYLLVMEKQAEELPIKSKQIENLKGLLKEVSFSGVEHDDERLDYVTVQIDRDLWKAIRKEIEK